MPPRSGRSSRRSATASRGHSDTEVISRRSTMGRGGDDQPPHRHVRLRAVGSQDRRLTWSATVSASSRSIWAAQRALLFGSELKALRAHPGWQPAHRSRRARGLSALQLRAGAALDLPRASHKLPPGTILDVGRGAATDDRAPTGRARRRPRRQARRFDGSDDEADGAARRAAARCGQRADGGRRAARRVPVGRHRFLDRRRR